MKKLLSGTAFAFLLALTALSASPATLAQTKGKTDSPKKVEKAKAAAGVTIEIYRDSADEFRFRIKDGETLLATSGKGYEKKADCQAVIDNLKAHLAKAKIDDKSADKAK